MIAFALWDAGELEKNTQQKASYIYNKYRNIKANKC